jgi:hypothetical protein
MMRPKGIVTSFSDGGTRLTRAQLLWKPHSKFEIVCFEGDGNQRRVLSRSKV